MVQKVELSTIEAVVAVKNLVQATDILSASLRKLIPTISRTTKVPKAEGTVLGTLARGLASGGGDASSIVQ